jgi:hypothetical protein
MQKPYLKELMGCHSLDAAMFWLETHQLMIDWAIKSFNEHFHRLLSPDKQAI